MAFFFTKKTSGSKREQLRSHGDDLQRFAHDILVNDPSAEPRLTEFLNKKEERQRWAFLKILRERIRDIRDENPSRTGFFKFTHVHLHEEEEQEAEREQRISALFARQEAQIIQQRKKSVKRWLAYMLPVFNKQRMLQQDAVQEELAKLGHELEHEGIQAFENVKAKDLGRLSADTHDEHAKQQGRDIGDDHGH